MTRNAIGFDGNGYTVGDRVEAHPGTNVWVMGARFGTVTFVSKDASQVRVKMDKLQHVLMFGADRVRALV